MKILYKGVSAIVVMMMFVQPVFALTIPDSVAYSKKAVSTEVSSSLSPSVSSAKATSSSTSKNILLDGQITSDFVEGEILVKYKKTKINLDTTSGKTKAAKFETSKLLENKEDLEKINISVLRIKDGKTVEQKIVELNADSNVEYAQPNFQYYPTVISTDDTHRAQLWGLDNTGQTINGTVASGGVASGTPDSDINAPEAWAISVGTSSGSSIIVAVIDSGVAYNHPDLLSNMWNGASCKDENGSALGSCNYGYDYEDNDKTPLPSSSSHGTHVAGTIAAVKNNNLGVIGVAPNAEIMALKTSLTTSDNVKAINFARHNGAKVINASWAGSNFDQLLKDAIDAFPGIFVAAAGNDSLNNETSHSYPSDYNSTNIISVAATDQNDVLSDFSNYGVTSVDVGAPGTNIYSTIAGETALLNETFEGAVPPAVPAGWVSGGTANNWGTYDLGAGTKVLYGDHMNVPYVNNANSIITLPTYNLGGNTNGATISFITKCDTEYSPADWFDYMALELSSDGSNFTQVLRWDEAYLDLLNGDSSDIGGAVHEFEETIPSQYLTSNFKLRFRWVTDETFSSDDGCLVDNILITKLSDGSDEGYNYSIGTSMAAPHVAGLAALIYGYNPTLTTSEVKNAILSTGDSLPSLAVKTVTGKRINAQSALLLVTPGKAITAFALTDPSTTGVINEGAKTVSLTVPYGTNLTALIPTISVSAGASVSPLSGVANNFTASTTYTVTAVDSTTQPYIVTTTVAAPSTISTVTSGTYAVNDGASTVTGVAYGTSQADFLAALAEGESNQTWNTSSLSDPVVTGDTLLVTAQDGTTKTYTLTVALNPAKNITSFSFPEGVGVVGSDTIVVTVPYGTDVTALVPTIGISGASVSPNTGVAQNFSSPVEYTVTAADSSTKVYTVTVNIAPNAEADILSFDSSSPVAIGNIVGTDITLTVPYGTILSNLPIIITLSEGASVSPVQGNTTFATSSPVTYTVTAEDDATTQEYTVTVDVALNTSKDITTFNFAGLSPTVVGGISGTNITLTVPYGTGVTALVPTIGISGASVSPNTGVAQNFSSPVEYTVTAADSSTKVYTVTVDITAPSDIATLTSATYIVSTGGGGSESISDIPYGTPQTSFLAALTEGESNQTWNTSGLSDPIVTGDTLVITAQDGTTVVTYTATVDLPSDVATVTSGTYTVNDGASTIANIPYATSQAIFLAALTEGESNQTWNTSSLSDPVVSGDTLLMTAQDGVTTKTYTLTVALNPAKAITGFTIANQVGITTVDENTHTVTIVMPFGTDVTNLAPSVTIAGASVSPGTGVSQDFTSSSTYTVTAADSTSQEYVVTVQVLLAIQTAPDGSGNANISSTTPQVVVTNPNQSVEITVTEVADEPTIDVSAFITNGEGILPEITINSAVADVEIPAGTTVTSADIGWNGIIAAPTVTTVTLPPTSGKTKTLTAAIEIGYTGAKLSFDKAVRILLPGQAGKRAGYVRDGISFTEITLTCAGDSQVVGDALSVDGDCKKDVGDDLVIWTKHFTSFAAYTQTNISTGGGGGGSGGSSSRTTSPATAPVATTAPGVVTTNPGVALTTPLTTPQVVNTFKFLRDLDMGAQGADVTKLQNLLTREGVYFGPISGYFGPLTFAAVKVYQTKVGVMSTGYVGPLTRDKLNTGQYVTSSVINNNSEIKAKIAALRAQIVVLMLLLIEQVEREATAKL